MTQNCPLCGKKEHLVSEDLKDEGSFYTCHEEQGGCGSTFRVTTEGECVDIF
jgi:transposase-like protein